MKVGDLVKLSNSKRKNGQYAGMLALIIDVDEWENPTVNIDGQIKSFHYSQIEEIMYYENR